MSHKTKTKKYFFFPIVFGLSGIILFSLFFIPNVFAQTTGNLDVGLQQIQQTTGLSGQDIRTTIANIIKVLLGLVGLVAVILVLYAGFLIMTAGGKPDQVEKGKKLLQNGVIGLLIIVSAYGIVTFVFTFLVGSGSGGDDLIKGGGPQSYSGSVGGSSIIDSHYPMRNQKDVARNTSILITFREPIDIASMVNDNGTPNNLRDDTLKTDVVQIRKSIDSPANGPFVDAVVGYTQDLQTFRIIPNELLGSNSEFILYSVVLKGTILKLNGKPAFGVGGGYDWSFEVGNTIDNTPPKVETVFPVINSENPRNTKVQVTFNEAMDPTTLAGRVSGGFSNISIAGGGSAIDGTFSVSNQYRTVEFVTGDLCGTNSCGQDVYCLPGGKIISVALRAATLSGTPPSAVFPYDGITDVVGNSLDGNADGTAQGPDAGDNYTYSFNTTNLIDLTPPSITGVTPTKNQSGVLFDDGVSVDFSKVMSLSTINIGTVQLDNINYWVGGHLDTDTLKTTVDISHDLFSELTDYQPILTSGINDIYQNCFNPCVGP